ncbi:hypothetical protein M011DRAFT_410769 [Sporormia fimetaria CBS 119925]|uniref:Zn(2)-C6 fungal-type domain-containing protein n=1 Tax=Sporormia fimetaria CBS 119925 TaxID=1340428 RepID=A0A6A6V214_9PLEO|nr:hypothetical protein M011DRAFT_410769 [Sporormia fimetaria CBS 119925]
MTEQDEDRRRKRARLACVACNARRVRCNVTESQPCHNCIAGNVHCETRPSRRGKHIRKRKGSVAGEEQAASPAAMLPSHHHEDEVAASRVLASLSSNFHAPEPTINQHYEEILGTGANSNGSAPQTSAHNHEHEEDAVYLGESNALRYVPGLQPSSLVSTRRPSLLKHAVPNALKADSLMPQWEAERRRARIEALQADGAFSFPPSITTQALLKAYFKWFHPNFAVVDEAEVWRKHAEESMSPLLMQAMLFIGVIHCGEATLLNLGWGSRHRAKYLFYTRAKDIYDAEYETRKITVIQALFLMSFWRAGALLEKDARHWLGTAMTLAQTKALHRHAGDLDPRVQSLRRRIWWSIYIRERQCSSSLGLPNRIRDEDCDIELLSPRDFLTAFEPSTSPQDITVYTTYMIGLMELTRILGRVVDAAYLPNRTLSASHRDQIRDELLRWKANLPPAMQLSNDSGVPSFQASMLHLAYNNLLILLYRSAFISHDKQVRETDGDIALQAATRNSRIVEDLLPTGMIGHAQMHVITNLFNTLCIHVAHLRRASGIPKTITEHRAKLCLLGLQELQKTWEVTNWVLQLFFQYLDRATAARLEMEADGVGFTSAVRHTTGAQEQPHIPAPIHTPADVHPGEADGGRSNADNDAGAAMTPWSWTTDEANQYLFSQIENDFAFGEGGLIGCSPGERFEAQMGSILPELLQAAKDD